MHTFYFCNMAIEQHFLVYFFISKITKFDNNQVTLAVLDYHFVTREEMTKAIENNEFIENAEFSGNLYGTRLQTLSYFLFLISICKFLITICKDVFGLK